MGIFSSHNQSMHTASTNHQGAKDETGQTASISDRNTHSSAHSSASSQKTACGCGSCHQAKPIEEDVVEVKEEWDY